MSGYYERLADSLEAAVGRRAALAARTERRRRRALAGAAIAALGALCLALAIGGSGGGVQPAYAVTVNPDGSVALSVRELLGVGPANARLARLGVRARLVRRETSCTARVRGTLLPPGELGRETHSLRLPPGGAHLSRDRELELQEQRVEAELRFLQSMLRPTHASGEFEVVINPATIPKGETLLLAFRTVRSGSRVAADGQRRASHAIGGSIELVKGEAPRCLPSE